MRILGAGDNVVDRYLTLGMEFPGGNAVNAAVFARRAGAESAYLGVLGDDPSGIHVFDALRSEGVDTSLVRVEHAPNAFAEVQMDGTERVFVRSYRGVAMFEPTEADLDAMAGFDAVHTAYTGPFAGHVAGMASRTRVSFDFGTRWDPYARETRDMLPSLFLASFSGSHLGDDAARALAADAVAAGAKHVLVTRGAEGAYLGSADGVVHGSSEPIEAIDTLGAGDAFIAATLVGLVAGNPVEQTLGEASRQAARVCTTQGAFGYGRSITVAEGPADLAAEVAPEPRTAG